MDGVANAALFGTRALGAINGASTGIAVGASGIGPVLYAVAHDSLGPRGYVLCVQVGSVAQLASALALALLARRALAPPRPPRPPSPPPEAPCTPSVESMVLGMELAAAPAAAASR